MNAPEDTPKTSTAPVQGKHFSTGAYVLAGIAGVFTGIVILPLAMWGVDVLDHDYFGYYDRCHPQGDKG